MQRTLARSRAVGTSLLVCLLAGACSQYVDPNVPEPIRPFIEPEFGGEYLLYRPSSYNRDQSWPLVIVCHGFFPDSPDDQIRSWTQLAEGRGFLVAAPALESGRDRWPPEAPEQIPLLRNDEKRILGTVQHIRAAHNVSEDRIFIHGYSGGAYAALHTGLRHPDLFRAVSLAHPRFDVTYLSDAAGLIDRHQPLFVNYELTDAITGKNADRCIDWLDHRSVELTVDPHATSGKPEAGPSVDFYEEVVRTHPWIRIRAFPAAGRNPLQIQFKLHCSYQPTHFQWEFEGGVGSSTAEPVHTFAEPGTYRVIVTVNGPLGGKHRRAVSIKVPEVVLTTIGESPIPAEPAATPESP